MPSISEMKLVQVYFYQRKEQCHSEFSLQLPSCFLRHCPPSWPNPLISCWHECKYSQPRTLPATSRHGMTPKDASLRLHLHYKAYEPSIYISASGRPGNSCYLYQCYAQVARSHQPASQPAIPILPRSSERESPPGSEGALWLLFGSPIPSNATLRSPARRRHMKGSRDDLARHDMVLV